MASTKHPKHFLVTANGIDARYYAFKNKSRNKIALSMALEAQLARQWWGISADEYDALPGNPDWVLDGGMSKADVIAAYRMHRLMEAISNDVQLKKHK